MPTTSYTEPVAAPAAAVWAILADFSDVSWIPLAQGCTVEGSGPGMRRLIGGGGDGPPIVEELVGLDADRRELRYRIAENNPLPVVQQDVVATVREDGDTSTVTWEVEYAVPEDGGDERAAVEAMGSVYTLMAGWLGDAAR